MRSSLCVFFGLAVVSTAAASQIVSVDLLDQPQEGILPPAGVACVDVMVDVSDGDSWTAAGIRVITVGSTTLRYATDPNTGFNMLTNPTTANRHVTFFSEPRARDGNARYNNGGAAAAGRYSPAGPTAQASATEVNVAYFASPPETAGSPSVDGAIFRIAVNLPLGTPSESVQIFMGQTPPSHIVSVFFRCVADAQTSPGIASATFDVPSLTGFDWGLGRVIPEPMTLTLLCCGIAVFRRRT